MTELTEFQKQIVKEIMDKVNEMVESEKRSKIIAEKIREKRQAISTAKQTLKISRETLIWMMVAQKLTTQKRAVEEKSSFNTLWKPIETQFKEDVKKVETVGFKWDSMFRRANQLVSFDT